MMEFEKKKEISWTPDQLAVLTTTGKNILVSASAGSGKTTIMIEKIAKLICDFKVPITNFLVVTFTKASAADMKQKLIGKLKNSNDEFVKSQVQNVEISDICNLHSFCSRLISTYFYEIGIDPSYTIIDEEQEKLLSEKALKRLFEKHEQENDEQFFELFNIFNSKRSDRDLKKIITYINKLTKVNLGGINNLFEKLEMMHNEDLPNNVSLLQLNQEMSKKCAYFAKKAEQFAQRCHDFNEPKMYDYFSDVATNLKTINIHNTFAVNSKNVNEFKFERLASPRKQKFLSAESKQIISGAKYYIEKYKEICLNCDESKIKKGLSFTKQILNKMLCLSTEFDEIYGKLKMEMCGLDFNDLEQYALKILNNQNILKEIKEKYKFVFVDEYQDINEIQEKIITLISSENNRFMVGDVKQSIYGFRLCDPSMFLEKYTSYDKSTNDSKLIKLNDNFRSHPDILNFVNRIFSNVMTEQFGNIDYAQDAKLVAGKKWEKSEPAVELCVIKKYSEREECEVATGVYSVLNHKQENEEAVIRARKEAKVVAEKIKALKGKYDLSKIAILVAKRNEIVDEIIDILRSEKIRVSSDSSYNLLDKPYIAEIINFAKYCVNTDDDFLLFKVLKSNLFNFSDQDLIELRLSDMKSRFYDTIKVSSYVSENGLIEKINKFNELTQKYARLSKIYSIKKFAKIVIEDFKLREIAYTFIDGTQRNDDLDKLLSKLPEVGVVDFCLNYDEVDFMQENSSGGDAVQIMTIHGSKGMEFDVVFVMSLNDRFDVSLSKDKVVYNKNYGLAIYSFDQNTRQIETTIPRALIEIAEEKKRLEEEQRLLYVALTRAIKKMYVVCTVNTSNLIPGFPEKPTSFLDWFKTIIYDDLNGIEYDFVKTQYYEFDSKEKIGGKNRNSLLLKKIELKVKPKWFNYAFSECVKIPLKNSISKMLSISDEPENIKFNENLENNFSSLDRGSAYHKVLSLIDLHKIGTFKSQIQQILFNKLDSSEQKLVDSRVILKILSMSIFSDILPYDKIFQEREFFAKMSAKMINKDANGEFTLQGIIDLIIIKEDKIILVDYKTGKYTEEKIARYKLQLDTYANVIERIYNKRKIEKYLIFIDEQKIIEI